MMVIQQWEKLLPYAQQLGIKYEIRVCSHLLSCYLLLTAPKVVRSSGNTSSLFPSYIQLLSLKFGLNSKANHPLISLS